MEHYGYIYECRMDLHWEEELFSTFKRNRLI